MLFVLLACADSGTDDTAADASITFLDPVDGDTLAVGAHPVSLIVDGFSLVEPIHNVNPRATPCTPPRRSHGSDVGTYLSH